MKQKSLYILTAAVLATLLIGGIAAWQLNEKRIPDGYVRVNSYVYIEEGSASCAANSPTCGVCPGGKVVDKQCYVPKGSVFDGL